GRPALLYDDDCRFCRACADLVSRWDGRGTLGLLPFSSPAAIELMAPLDPAVRDRSMHLVAEDGSIASAGEAMVDLLEFLPGLRWLGRLGHRIAPLGALIGWSYRLVAGNRGFLSRIVPDRPSVMRLPGA
ncbi:MAG TPA: DCC1-like thiol-disulfide oxidoreductase family protein, partial [Castellaniella sp.]|nr:DCC1-like thiol-disulfide oxidoreductase family protein [Castellaniella sp.]